ncbi:unnamed protein product [Camellia sinensis]
MLSSDGRQWLWIFVFILVKDVWRVGAAKAEQFCKAFRSIHKKLVYEEMSLDAARSFLSSPKSYGE